MPSEPSASLTSQTIIIQLRGVQARKTHKQQQNQYDDDNDTCKTSNEETKIIERSKRKHKQICVADLLHTHIHIYKHIHTYTHTQTYIHTQHAQSQRMTNMKQKRNKHHKCKANVRQM